MAEELARTEQGQGLIASALMLFFLTLAVVLSLYFLQVQLWPLVQFLLYKL
jgi:hypothetical protein